MGRMLLELETELEPGLGRDRGSARRGDIVLTCTCALLLLTCTCALLLLALVLALLLGVLLVVELVWGLVMQQMSVSLLLIAVSTGSTREKR